MNEAQFVAYCVEELAKLIAQEGADTIAAFIGEPVMGTGGILPPPAGYWPAIQQVLKKHDILLISDEVVCGFGRLGSKMGAQHYGMLAAIGFMADRDERRAFEPTLKVGPRVSATAMQRGLIARAMPHGDILGFAPPLVTPVRTWTKSCGWRAAPSTKSRLRCWRSRLRHRPVPRDLA
jgi:adenosylmethionine-8-amino-7-oxononanoate aminotransferase